MSLAPSLDDAFRETASLSNDELKSQLVALVRRDHHLTADLLVHPGEVDARRMHTSWAFSSLFRYVVESLNFSEDEAYKRITAARVVRKFPAALGLVLSGKLHLSGLLVVAPCLTPQNHIELLGAACGKTKRQVERLVAERFPRPDVPASVRKLPTASPEAAGTNPTAQHAASDPVTATATRPAPSTDTSALPLLNAPPTSATAHRNAPTPVCAEQAPSSEAAHPVAEPLPLPPPPSRPADRPRIDPRAPGRYRVTFTASASLVQKLERAQDLTSHAIPPSDIAALFDRALDALIAREEKRRFSASPASPARSPLSSARRRASAPEPTAQLAPERVPDEPPVSTCPDSAETPRDHARESRYLPAHVRRGVSERDGGRCTFVDPKTGRRCNERRFIEFEHIEPHALGGPATPGNVTLRCAAHNALAARRVFGEQYVAAAVASGRRELVSHEHRR